jgi:hypothetical protein
VRRWLVVLLSLVAVAASASQAWAQPEEPAGEVVPDTLPVDPTATSAAPPIVTEPPATTLPPGCSGPPPPHATFTGELVAVGPVADSKDLIARFRVADMISGTLDGFEGGGLVDVDYARDVRFLRVGERYLVAADVSPDAPRLISKARIPPPLFGDNQVVGVNDGVICPPFDDLVVTRLVDGTAIDVGVLSPLLSNKGKIGGAIARPALVAFLALVGLVALKRLLIGVGRLVKWSVRRQRERALARRQPATASRRPGPEAQPEPLPTREPSTR